MAAAAKPAYLTLQFGILLDALTSRSSGWLAKVAAALGLLSLVTPFDRIAITPVQHPHADQAVALLAGFVAARGLVPPSVRGSAVRRRVRAWRRAGYLTAWQRLQFKIRILRSDLANFFPLQHRHADALLITGKNSGTHWLKFMLSCAIAEQYGVPMPTHASGHRANTIIGAMPPRQRDSRVPRIAASHTIPSVAFRWRWCRRLLPHPPVVVLVREVQAAMASHYLKWQERIAQPLPEYVRGDPSGRRYKADLWWYIRFFNRWGDLSRARPDSILIVRYEDLQADTRACLRRIATHMRLDLSDPALARALQFAERDAIRALLDPTDTEIAVPPDGASASVVYGGRDKAFMRNAMARYLRYDFGYGYDRGAAPAIA